MNRFISFVLFLAVVLFIYIAAISVPFANRILGCYDNVKQNFDFIEVQSRAQGYSDSRRCELRYDQLETAKKCIDLEIESYSLPINLDSFSRTVVPVIRPGTLTVSQLIVEHDTICQDYPQFMFDPNRFVD